MERDEKLCRKYVVRNKEDSEPGLECNKAGCKQGVGRDEEDS
jgi:hypothetical protein